MSRKALHSAALFALLLGSCGAEAPPPPHGEVAVAAFAEDPAGGGALPDVGAGLAAELSGLGVGGVVPPSVVGDVGADATTAERVALRDRVGARTFVVGSVSRAGPALSLAARVLDLDSGAALGEPIVEQAESDTDLPRAIGALAERVASRILAPPPPAAAAETPPKRRKRAAGVPREPIEIQADTLDAQTVSGGRRLTFTGHVDAVQGDVTLRCDSLQAFYPTGASEPDRLMAKGNIHVTQRDRTATCSEAIFYRTEDKLVCTGSPAELTEECSRAEAERFTFYLETEKVEMVRPKVFGRECSVPGAAP